MVAALAFATAFPTSVFATVPESPQSMTPMWQQVGTFTVYTIDGRQRALGTLYACKYQGDVYYKLVVNGREYTDIRSGSWRAQFSKPATTSDGDKNQYFNHCAGGVWYW